MKHFQKHTALSLITFCMLIVVQSLSAQNRVAGSVTDVNGAPLPYANALLLNAHDSTLVRGMVVTDNGNYAFENVPAGTFLMRFSMIGFVENTSGVFILDENTSRKDIAPVQLKESTAMLGEVQVVAKRPFLEQRIDRTVVNVSNSITNAGSTALEVLQRSPGVQVNTLSKSISLLGKEGVVVMINGKISRQPSDAVVQMLEGMNSDNIDHIELIHTPPANFEAEGNAGIINIVLKSTSDAGLNGGYSAKGGYGNAEKYGTSLNFNYRKNKVNWYGNYEYNLNNNPQVFTNYRAIQVGSDFLETDTYSDRPQTPTAVQNARIGADFQISPKTVVGVLGSFFDRNWYMEAQSDVICYKNGEIESRQQMPNTETNHNRSYAGNINLTHQLTKRQTLSLDADIIQYNINNPSDYAVFNVNDNGNTALQNELRISKKTPIQIAVAKADYGITLGNSLKFESGAKLVATSVGNDVRVETHELTQDWEVIPEYTSNINFTEDIMAAYSSVACKINAKTDLKAGLRYEHTMSNLGTELNPHEVQREYGSWFPSLFVTRKITESNSLNFSYSRRTTRPKIRQLSGGTVFFDPSTLMNGNPTLRSSFTDALKLDYNIKSWRFGVSYSSEKGPIRWVPMVDLQTNTQINRAENLDQERVASANLFIPFHPAKWWGGQFNVFANGRKINFVLEGNALETAGFDYGFNSTQTFTLPRKFTFEISGNFNSAGYWGVSKGRANGSFNLGIQKDFGEKWGKLRFSATDLFATDSWFSTTAQPDLNLLLKQSWQVAERTFMLSWTNTFGNKKLKSTRQRQTGSSEEMGRI